MSSRKDCDCDISQLIVKVFTKLLWLLDSDCNSQGCSRGYFPRRSGNRKKKKCGGAGSRHRRFEARHAGTARRTSTSSPVPDRAIPPAWAPPSVPGRAPPDRPKPTASIPPPPPRSASLIFQEEQAKLIAKLGSTKRPVHTSGPKTPPSPKSALQICKEWKEKEQAKRKSAKPKCELCPLICVCEDVDLNRKAVKQGQAARQCSLDPKQDVGLRRSTRQHTLESSQPNSQPDQLHQNVTQFLKQASEVKNKEAENRIKFEKMKSTPGPGFQKTQTIPFNNPFCFMCLKYVEKIHFCSSEKKYFNIDERNLFYIVGDTPDQVSGTSDNPGRCWVFNTKKEMKNQMIFKNSVQKLEYWKKVFDDLTNTELQVFNQDEKKYGMETAMANARRIKAKSNPTFKEKLEKATLAKLAELPSAMNTYKEALEQKKPAYLVSISKSNEVTFQFER